jgi:hypothetical protein
MTPQQIKMLELLEEYRKLFPFPDGCRMDRTFREIRDHIFGVSEMRKDRAVFLSSYLMKISVYDYVDDKQDKLHEIGKMIPWIGVL